MKTIQIIVRGRVQGVGFRYYTKKKAEEYHIFGFVANKSDGSVYVEAEGKSLDVDTFADWCAQGPEWARVQECKITSLPFVGYKRFDIK